MQILTSAMETQRKGIEERSMKDFLKLLSLRRMNKVSTIYQMEKK